MWRQPGCRITRAPISGIFGLWRNPYATAPSQVIAALSAAKGMVPMAAQHLQCDPIPCKTIAGFPTVEARTTGRTERSARLAELRLWAAVQRDEPWAITFCLKTIGRSRGYGERLDLNVSIQAAAAKVAAEFGLTASEVIHEAKLLLLEVEDDG